MTQFYMLAKNVIVRPLFNKAHTAKFNLTITMAFDFNYLGVRGNGIQVTYTILKELKKLDVYQTVFLLISNAK